MKIVIRSYLDMWSLLIEYGVESLIKMKKEKQKKSAFVECEYSLQIMFV